MGWAWSPSTRIQVIEKVFKPPNQLVPIRPHHAIRGHAVHPSGTGAVLGHPLHSGVHGFEPLMELFRGYNHFALPWVADGRDAFGLPTRERAAKNGGSGSHTVRQWEGNGPDRPLFGGD